MESVANAVTNPLRALAAFGQSIWLDDIRRDLLGSGELKQLADVDGLGGVTSNPAIFEKAIREGGAYASRMESLVRSGDLDVQTLYERLAIEDIRDAADVLRGVYEATSRRDGYVSFEVSPYLAHDTAATVAEARRLWALVDRPNLMIKVPATPMGIPAIAQLIGEGINVNVTLLFAVRTYEAVAEAYLSGLEAFVRSDADRDRIAGVASVASFFVSRVDTAVDRLLESRLADGAWNERERETAGKLVGTAAVANAKLAYQRYLEIIGSDRWRALAARGAQTQRLLWASTGTKNARFSDVKYVEELIGPDTVNTMPPATLRAYRDHGAAAATLTANLDDARNTISGLANAGIDMPQVTDRLLDDAVGLFADAFDRLLAAVANKRAAILNAAINRQDTQLPDTIARDVAASLDRWRITGGIRRLWTSDASLWTSADESGWLGWLRAPADARAQIKRLDALVSDVTAAGFRHVVLLGMGGSSLCPEVMRAIFGTRDGFPVLHVLDSTDPAQIAACERRIDLLDSLFIVSSKSGSTLEPNILKQYFFERVREAGLGHEAGDRFIAITDPGSKLQQLAERDGFRHIVAGTPSIGGRYSALSPFGIVPSAVMGIDVANLLEQTETMVRSCAASVPPAENPGVVLGTVLGICARHGRNKLTLVASPTLAPLGAWIEQLVAESTGKQGQGVIPVDAEDVGAPAVYRNDRVFVAFAMDHEASAPMHAKLKDLAAAGHPVVRIAMNERHTIGQEFFRWEIATAVAGAIIGINPFDQPDVEASKEATRALTSEYERSGQLAGDTPLRSDSTHLIDHLKSHLDLLGEGDYFAILAYLEMSDEHRASVQRIRQLVRDEKRVATCVGFGPRFLHSTGQAYKGGPNSGVFLQITADDSVDLAVPGQRYTFGVVKAAQALGDLQVLNDRRRRALRVHLGADVAADLRVLHDAITQALVS